MGTIIHEQDVVLQRQVDDQLNSSRIFFEIVSSCADQVSSLLTIFLALSLSFTPDDFQSKLCEISV